MEVERLYDVYALDEDIKILEKFIKNYKEVQDKYKDDKIQAEIERSCYFEEVPAKAIEHLIARYKELEEENIHWKGQYHLLSRKIAVISKSKVKEILEKYKYTDTGETFKLVEFYNEI